ncbi:hypothetical protein OHP008_05670 [Helicobacter pylori]|nr:hypothetical protein OHP008_05670 [Helicobacter pylori]
MGFWSWKKTLFFQNARPIVGVLLVSAFLDLVGFIGLVFIVAGLIEIIFFLNKSLIFGFFSYNKI